MEKITTYAYLLANWEWRPIAHCPGRFRLDRRGATLSPSALVGSELPEYEFKVSGARDPVIVIPLGDGTGLISYRRESGSYVHTLNTRDGFERKLAQLGITLPLEIESLD